MAIQPFVNAKAERTKDVNGQPAWCGKYQLQPDGMWFVARSGYGALMYTTPEHAVAGAIWCAMNDHKFHQREQA